MDYTLYEVIDHRNVPEETKLAMVAVLENLPGRVNVWQHTGKGVSFELSDRNYEWKDGTFTLFTKEGMINFIPLTPDSDVFMFVTTPFDGLLEDCLR